MHARDVFTVGQFEEIVVRANAGSRLRDVATALLGGHLPYNTESSINGEMQRC